MSNENDRLRILDDLSNRLSAEERRLLEGAMAKDRSLAREVARHRKLDRWLPSLHVSRRSEEDHERFIARVLRAVRAESGADQATSSRPLAGSPGNQIVRRARIGTRLLVATALAAAAVFAVMAALQFGAPTSGDSSDSARRSPSREGPPGSGTELPEHGFPANEAQVAREGETEGPGSKRPPGEAIAGGEIPAFLDDPELARSFEVIEMLPFLSEEGIGQLLDLDDEDLFLLEALSGA